MENKRSSFDDFLVSVPISFLIELQKLPSDVAALRAENSQLRRELEGLRNIQNQSLVQFADVLRKVNTL